MPGRGPPAQSQRGSFSITGTPPTGRPEVGQGGRPAGARDGVKANNIRQSHATKADSRTTWPAKASNRSPPTPATRATSSASNSHREPPGGTASTVRFRRTSRAPTAAGTGTGRVAPGRVG